MSSISKEKRDINWRRVYAWSSAAVAALFVIELVVMVFISIWTNNPDLTDKCANTAVVSFFIAMVVALTSGFAFDE